MSMVLRNWIKYLMQDANSIFDYSSLQGNIALLNACGTEEIFYTLANKFYAVEFAEPFIKTGIRHPIFPTKTCNTASVVVRNVSEFSRNDKKDV